MNLRFWPCCTVRHTRGLIPLRSRLSHSRSPVLTAFCTAGSANVTEPGLQQTTAPEAIVSGIITGEIRNGTSGEVEAGLEIILSVYDSSERVIRLTTQAGPEGSFTFDPVELDPELIYLVTAEFEGVLYSSMPAQPDPVRISCSYPSWYSIPHLPWMH